MFRNQTIDAYVTDAASDKPTPGGGSIAALAGALGSCMASMAAHFTAGKKKFAEVEDEIMAILDAIKPLREELLCCMEEDALAFATIGKAYSLPKETDEEKAFRAAEIQNSLGAAMTVPLRVMEAAVAGLRQLPQLAEIGNPNLVSDTGVAAILLEASVRAAFLNVRINAVSIKDQNLVEEATRKTESIMRDAATLLAETMELVNQKIG